MIDNNKNYKLSVDLSDRSLSNSNFSFTEIPPEDLSLDDLLVCYSDTVNIKAIPLDIMKRYPLIYDVLHQEIDNNIVTKNFSIIVCPYTLTSANYNCIINLTNLIDNNTIVLKLSSPESKSKSKNNPGENISETMFNMFDYQDNIIRYDVQIKTLKNVFTDHMHALFLILNNDFYKSKKDYIISNSINTILNESNLNDSNLNDSNLIHPKTLVYIINYQSSQTNKYKSTIIVGADANLQNISGYDTSKSKFKKYFKKNKDKINEKMGYIYPTQWFITRIFLKESPIIFLNSFFK
jgi:hypothetical protein